MLKKVQIFRGGGGGIIFEIAINFTKEIPLKNVGWFQKFGGNTLVNRVQFDGWMVGWLDGWTVGWYRNFRVHSRSKWTQDPSYARTSLAPLGNNLRIIANSDFEVFGICRAEI